MSYTLSRRFSSRPYERVCFLFARKRVGIRQPPKNVYFSPTFSSLSCFKAIYRVFFSTPAFRNSLPVVRLRTEIIFGEFINRCCPLVCVTRVRKKKKKKGLFSPFRIFLILFSKQKKRKMTEYQLLIFSSTRASPKACREQKFGASFWQVSAPKFLDYKRISGDE